MPRPRIINVHCKKCDTHLYRYKKDKPGHLVKCYKHAIVVDHTNGKLVCHNCGQEFAREAMIHGKPANKIIQGKVYVK